MDNLNTRMCAYCNKAFSLEYIDRFGYKSILKTNHCSKSCATSNLRGISREALINKAVAYVKECGTYQTLVEVCSGIGHSSKTFNKHKISIKYLNFLAGQHKPKSKFQESVGEILREYFSDIETEKTYEGLVGLRGHPLRVDFYIPEINTVVEADGSQHSDENHWWASWKTGDVKSYDGIKDKFFKENNIRLVRIPYKKRVKKEDVTSRLNLK